MLPLLYVVRMDVEPDYLGEFVAWYDTRHGPDLIATGFHSCSAYHSFLGGPFICNVYEIPSVEILGSDAYVAVRQNDRQLTDEVLTKIGNHSNTVYTQEAVVGVPEAALREDTRPSRAGAVSAPVVSTLRLELADGAVERFLEWFAGEEADARRAAPGFLRMRAGRQCGKHPLFPSTQPDWIVLTEWATVDEMLADDAADPVPARYRAACGDAVSRLEHQAGALSATLLNSTNWTT